VTRSFAWLRKWWPAVLLGVSTVGTYGVGWYAFGVIIGPIEDETGWASGSISAAFSVSVLLTGVGAVFAGQMLDRFGGRPVQFTALAVGAALVLVAAASHSLPLFVATWGLGAGAIGAGLFYHVTMAMTTRLYPDDRAAAFSVLTFTGGFASPVFLPLAGFFVEEFGWRTGMRLLVLLMVLLAMPAALLITGRTRAHVQDPPGSLLPAGQAAAGGDRDPSAVGGGHAVSGAGGEEGYRSVRDALQSRRAVQMVLMFAAMWVSIGGMQVHQVPAIQAAGVSLATASFIAGLRGFMSLPGRAMLNPIVKRLGVSGALLASYTLMLAGLLTLAGGGFAGAISFAVITGVVFGVVSPLQGLYSAEIYGRQRIGSLLGAQQAIISAASASGPVILGAFLDAGAGYRAAVGFAAAMVALAIVLQVTTPGRTVTKGEPPHSR
jgi:MFS family permease